MLRGRGNAVLLDPEICLDLFWPGEKPDRFEDLAIKTVVLLAVLLAYAAGFVILYPMVASSVAESVAQGNNPALLQFVGP